MKLFPDGVPNGKEDIVTSAILIIYVNKRLNNYMSDKKKNKKVNHLSLKECESIIEKMGGQIHCQYMQQVLERQRTLLVKKTFEK
jgi:hypothetical protein